MSIVQLLDELLNPQDVWTSRERRQINNNIAAFRNNFVEVPQLDLYAVPGGLELKADLPGYRKEDIRVDVQGQLFILSGERQASSERDESRWHYAERHFGKFSRKIKLPFNIEVSRISAKYENGVLTVSIPQPNEPTVGQVQIN